MKFQKHIFQAELLRGWQGDLLMFKCRLKPVLVG